MGTEAVMALPRNVVSAVPVAAEFLSPDILEVSLISYELGGIAINDPSEGRMYQSWRCWVEGSAIRISPTGGAPVTTLLTGLGAITSVSLAFDSNMAPTVAFVEDGVVKLHWYDSTVEEFVTDTYAGATSGKVSTDDKRDSQAAASDVVFAYVRAGVLYWRQQRDRYGVEYTAGPTGGRDLRRFGMSTINRLQFELV